MAASWGRREAQVVAFLALLVLAEAAAAEGGNDTAVRSGEELQKYKRIIRSQLQKINKPAIKTILSPDGDLIDCVPTHLQPAFDHPVLQGSEAVVEDPPERPKGYETGNAALADAGGGGGIQQLWSSGGETCPEGTVPIRRTREEDILRASSARSFGRKPPAPAASTERDAVGGSHEHAVGYAVGEELYGAKASLNVWAPKLSSSSEFSLSQIWIISGSFATDLNTIEAGWQVSPQLYGDSSPRFFTYWTTDAYRETGCYNLLCSGFVQTSNRIAIGAAISPVSAFNGKQFDISLLIWKDPKHGNWWLEFGPGVLVGYWPSYLFNHLAVHGTMVQFGGEIFNTRPAGVHTSTQMGSGHYAEQGFRQAAYFRNLQVVDWDNSLIPAANIKVIADHPNCYDIQARSNNVWGNYFYFGGPGRSIRCP
ncbi:protein neprosin-like [Curcuma longa]|uniref:protein neprosin-like n=1 Tax=Curcuma longa TaxID=136217 RepID=UPI003D9F06BB